MQHRDDDPEGIPHQQRLPRASQKAHAVMRQMFNLTGDIDTTELGHPTITLDPLPTTAKTAAAADL